MTKRLQLHALTLALCGVACAGCPRADAPVVIVAAEGARKVEAAPPAPPGATSFRLLATPRTSPVRWLGPFPQVVRLPAGAIWKDGRLLALTTPEDELRPHVLAAGEHVDTTSGNLEGPWFESDGAISLLTPNGLRLVQRIPKRGTFLHGGESGMDWRGASPFGVFGEESTPAFLGDCSTGDFVAACARSSNGTWRSVRLHAGLARMRQRWWSFAIVPAVDRIYVLEKDDEACIAAWRTKPRGPCPQRFVLHDAERGALQKYTDVPLWAYHGSNSFMNAHAFHVGHGGAIRMWPVARDDGDLDDTKTGEQCSVDFLPNGTTHVECRPGRLAVSGAHALWQSGDRLHETVDAGVSWRPIKTPAPVTEKTDLACEALGCLVGDHIRLGWGER